MTLVVVILRLAYKIAVDQDIGGVALRTDVDVQLICLAICDVLK
jgi:hypothetical protein